MSFVEDRLALTYDDVLLVPQYSKITSRTQVDLSVAFEPNCNLSVPIISSPMDTITGANMAAMMFRMGGLGVIHRYNTVEQQSNLVKTSIKKGGFVTGAAVGVTGDYFERTQELVGAGAHVICIDVAHGHHKMVKDAIDRIKAWAPDYLHIMAGNVATREGYEALASWGADSVRCNVGGGSICTTRVQTGHGLIIADGGIRSAGDATKALAAGADLVMVGSLLSGTDETPGAVIEMEDGTLRKNFRGMASKEAQKDWRGKFSSLEGVATTVPCRGPVVEILYEFEQGIRSGCSYSGVTNLEDLKHKAKFIRQTAAGRQESSAHIFGRYS
jgi:IMP dehydrogenase